MAPRFVFLDRDGTINRSPPAGEYLARPDDIALLPGAAAAIRRLNDAGVWAGVVTNQQGVALGPLTAADVEGVNRRLVELLSAHGAHLDGTWVCPHLEGTCDCRKPLPGLLLAAQRANPEIDFERAAMVGDTERDTGAGEAVGARTLLLGRDAPDLATAVELLLSE